MNRLAFVAAAGLLAAGCSPRIHFRVEDTLRPRPRLYLAAVRDARPVNERVGYKIFYIDSISDEDYKRGFVGEFTAGLSQSLSRMFDLVDTPQHSDARLEVTVRNFYGEYSHTVKTVLWEYLSCTLLFIPRLVTDAIPYNSFAGRANIDLVFTRSDGTRILKTLDRKLARSVSTYQRGNRSTAKMLSRAIEGDLDIALREMHDALQ